MLKKAIKFKDLDGNELVEDFYFNLTKAEIAELQMSREGGFSEYLQKLAEKQSGKEIIATIKEIIAKSVGERSEDGKRFVKSENYSESFLQTDAYSELFMELVTDAGAAVLFIKAVVPEDIAQQVDADMETVELPAEENSEPAWIREGRDPSQAELRAATPEQLREAFIRKSNGAPAVLTEGNA